MKKILFTLSFLSLLVFLIILNFDRLAFVAKNRFLVEKNLEENILDDPDNPILNYSLGLKHYKSKRFQKARSFFHKAAANFLATDQQMKSLSYANLANASVRLAEIVIDKKQNKSDAKTKAIELLRESLKNYDSSIELDPVNNKVIANKKMAADFLAKLLNENNQQDKDNSSNQGDNEENNKSENGDDGSDNTENSKQNNSQGKNKSDSDKKKNNEGEKNKDLNQDEQQNSEGQADDRDDTSEKNGSKQEQNSQGNDQKNEKSDSSMQESSRNSDKGNLGKDQSDKVGQQNQTSDNSTDENSPNTKDSDQEENSNDKGSDDLAKLDANFDDEVTSENNGDEPNEVENESDSKSRGLATRLAKINADSELDRLDMLESKLRKKRIVGFTTKGVSTGQKGW